MPAALSKSQLMALEHMTQYARGNKHEAEQTIGEILQVSNIGQARFEEAVAKLKKHARVALHFHPDRPGPTMKSVASLWSSILRQSSRDTDPRPVLKTRC